MSAHKLHARMKNVGGEVVLCDNLKIIGGGILYVEPASCGMNQEAYKNIMTSWEQCQDYKYSIWKEF